MSSNNKGNGHETELIEFPCDFPIKVMGKSDTEFKNRALAIILKHCPDYKDKPTERLSRDNNYLALTFMVHATSKEQLDAIYTDLTECDEVLMAL